jgi:hypothetical protein
MASLAIHCCRNANIQAHGNLQHWAELHACNAIIGALFTTAASLTARSTYCCCSHNSLLLFLSPLHIGEIQDLQIATSCSWHRYVRHSFKFVIYFREKNLRICFVSVERFSGGGILELISAPGRSFVRTVEICFFFRRASPCSGCNSASVCLSQICYHQAMSVLRSGFAVQWFWVRCARSD